MLARSQGTGVKAEGRPVLGGRLEQPVDMLHPHGCELTKLPSRPSNGRFPGHRSPYLRSRDSRRSASGLPPVWQVGQYWSDLVAKDTWRMVSPHTGHGSPVAPVDLHGPLLVPLELGHVEGG